MLSVTILMVARAISAKYSVSSDALNFRHRYNFGNIRRLHADALHIRIIFSAEEIWRRSRATGCCWRRSFRQSD
jgi:hypothetical protein